MSAVQQGYALIESLLVPLVVVAAGAWLAWRSGPGRRLRRRLFGADAVQGGGCCDDGGLAGASTTSACGSCGQCASSGGGGDGLPAASVGAGAGASPLQRAPLAPVTRVTPPVAQVLHWHPAPRR